MLSYELQIDDGFGGDFISLIGADTDSLETTYTIEDGIVQGTIYRFRYRSKNVNGWSEFSPITYIKAATTPSRPPAPIFDGATATTIDLNFLPSEDSRGSEILRYELEMNTGAGSTTYNTITAYDSEESYQVVASDGLASGEIYKFRYRAVNEYGEGDYSDTIEVGASSFPDPPTTL